MTDFEETERLYYVELTLNLRESEPVTLVWDVFEDKDDAQACRQELFNNIHKTLKKEDELTLELELLSFNVLSENVVAHTVSINEIEVEEEDEYDELEETE